LTDSLDVLNGEIVASKVRNAGKTTFAIAGIYTPKRRNVNSSPGKKKEKTNVKAHIAVFPNMTVLENVMIGRHCRSCSVAELFSETEQQ
jgi:branched-chain amino acid transport system ATP-binding protein